MNNLFNGTLLYYQINMWHNRTVLSPSVVKINEKKDQKNTVFYWQINVRTVSERATFRLEKIFSKQTYNFPSVKKNMRTNSQIEHFSKCK